MNIWYIYIEFGDARINYKLRPLPSLQPCPPVSEDPYPQNSTACLQKRTKTFLKYHRPTLRETSLDPISGRQWCPPGHTSPMVKPTPGHEGKVLSKRSEDPYPHSDHVLPFSEYPYPQNCTFRHPHFATQNFV